MDHIKERLPKKRLSETASHLITSTRRKKSESNYKSSWRLWPSWCNKQQADAFRCDVTKILDLKLSLILLSYLRKVMNTGLLDAIGQPFLSSMIF